MSLCVAICTRARPVDLAACLRSVVRSPSVDEVVVASDGIDRDTDSAVSRAQARNPNIVFVRGPRIGLAANRNAVIGSTRSDYIHFLDDDARLSPDFLPAALPLVNERRIVTGWESRGGETVLPHHPDLFGFQHAEPSSPLRAIVINATIFPTWFLRANPFDEFYRFGSEEIDIAMRAVSAGLEIVPVDAGNPHLHVASTRAGNDRAATRSRIYFTARRYMRYEPSLSRFLVGVTGSAANAVGHGLKSSGLRGGIAGAVDASSALAAWATRRAPRPLDERSAPIPDGGKAASVTVVVATYRRAAQLRECIDGLRGQIRPPDQIVVVRRLEDAESASVTSEIGAYAEEVVVHAPGQTAALRAGADRATGDVLAFLDDDAVPRRDWLLRLLAPYADPGVVAVGGRDVVYHDGEIEVGSRRTVGRLSWLGRLTGNHHLGDGRARPVDFLKGCNCSYRREVFSIPIGLRGTGAQVANDLATSLRASTAFGRVIYEPGALVDHFPGTRFGDDTRVNPNRAAVSDSIYNQAFVVASLRPDMRNLRLAYLLAVGDRVSPGLGRSLLAVARGETEVAGRLRLSAATVIRATRDAGRHPLEFDTDPGTPTNGADRQRLARAGC